MLVKPPARSGLKEWGSGGWLLRDADNAALIARLRVSPEGQEGLSAFLDKRKPRWTES